MTVDKPFNTGRRSCLQISLQRRLLLLRVKSDNGFGSWLKITSGFKVFQYLQVVILQLHRKVINDASGRKRMLPSVIIHGSGRLNARNCGKIVDMVYVLATRTGDRQDVSTADYHTQTMNTIQRKGSVGPDTRSEARLQDD